MLGPLSISRRRLLQAAGVGVVALPSLSLVAACGGTVQSLAEPTLGPTARAPVATAAVGTSSAASGMAPAQATAEAIQNAPIAAQAPAGVARSTPNAKVASSLLWLVRASDAENNGQKKVFLPAAARLLPNLKIDYLVVPNTSGAYNQKILTMAAGGQPPDLFGFGQNYMYFWAIGLPQALDEYIAADKWDVDNHFLPGLMDIYTVHGKRYGISQDTTFGNLGFYNKELLQQAGVPAPPVDWDDANWTTDRMVETAHKLTKKTGTPDAVFGVNWGISNGPDAAYLWGDDAWKPEHYQNFIAQASQLDHPGCIDAYQFRADLLWKEHVMNNAQDSKIIGNIGDYFRNQRTAMLFGGGWNFWDYNDVTKFTVGVCAVPGNKANKVTNFDDFWIMARASKNKDGVWSFIRMLSDNDILADYALVSGVPVTARGAYQQWLANQVAIKKMSLDELQKVTLGAIAAKRTQESTDHLFLDWSTISTTFSTGIAPAYNENHAVSSLMPGLKEQVDGVLQGIYARYQGKLPA